MYCRDCIYGRDYICENSRSKSYLQDVMYSQGCSEFESTNSFDENVDADFDFDF